VTGAQIVVLSILAYNLMISAVMIKRVGAEAKPITSNGAIIGVFIYALLSAGVIYLYAN
jgi:membrane protein CcdC involved in cytochrome C biogenesis